MGLYKFSICILTIFILQTRGLNAAAINGTDPSTTTATLPEAPTDATTDTPAPPTTPPTTRPMRTRPQEAVTASPSQQINCECVPYHYDEEIDMIVEYFSPVLSTTVYKRKGNFGCYHANRDCFDVCSKHLGIGMTDSYAEKDTLLNNLVEKVRQEAQLDDTDGHLDDDYTLEIESSVQTSSVCQDTDPIYIANMYICECEVGLRHHQATKRLEDYDDLFYVNEMVTDADDSWVYAANCTQAKDRCAAKCQSQADRASSSGGIQTNFGTKLTISDAVCAHMQQASYEPHAVDLRVGVAGCQSTRFVQTYDTGMCCNGKTEVPCSAANGAFGK